MTEQQQQWIAELSRCSFYPGSYDKRFVRDLESYSPDKELTEKQAAFLEKLAWRYRKQRGDAGMARPAGTADSADLDKLAAWDEGKPL
jgi:hypothetical protein